MADAIVTDINAYRAQKVGSANIEYFADWSDDRITKRHKLLYFIEAGHSELSEGKMSGLAFPDGYDPVNHPSDNIAAVYAEGLRRGVFVTSG